MAAFRACLVCLRSGSARSRRSAPVARAEAEKALADAYRDTDPSVLLARAAGAAAERLGNVQTLTLTPDLLAQFLGKGRGATD